MNYAWRPVRPLNNSAASFVAIVNNKCLLREIDGVRTTAADIRNSGHLDEPLQMGFIRARALICVVHSMRLVELIPKKFEWALFVHGFVHAYVCVRGKGIKGF